MSEEWSKDVKGNGRGLLWGTLVFEWTRKTTINLSELAMYQPRIKPAARYKSVI